MMKTIQIIVAFFIGVIAHAQSLEDYVAIAIKNNSNIKVAQANLALTQEKIHEVANLDNTNFSLGIFATTPETRVGSQLFKAGVAQKLPWFGEFKTKRQAVEALAETKKYAVSLSEKQIAFEVKKAYYAIYQQKAITAILKVDKQVLQTYKAMALAALSNNRATMSDVLRIQVQINELHRTIYQNKNSITSMDANFNRLLQREESLPVQVPDSLHISSVLVQKESVNEHPSVLQLEKMDSVYNLQKKLITIDQKPKISLGLDYVLVNKRPVEDLAFNGKDIWMPKFSLAIPIFNKKYSSQYKQIRIRQAALEASVINQKNTLEIALEQALLDFDNQLLSLEAAQQNKREIQQAIAVDLKGYQTGILDYDKILRLQLQKIKYELEEIEAIKKTFIAKAKVEYLTE